MAKKSHDSKILNAPMESISNIVRKIDSTGLNLSLKSENPTPGGVWFRIHHGMSAASYGEKITITLTPVQNGTQVDMLSECGMPTQMIDFGKNAKNIKVIFEHIENELKKAPASPPVVESPKGAKFCISCGTALPDNAVFCHSCGTKVNG